MVGPIVRLIIYNTDVSDRKSGKEVFEKSAQAGFQLGTYGTASHRVIIPPWNQHWSLRRFEDVFSSLYLYFRFIWPTDP